MANTQKARTRTPVIAPQDTAELVTAGEQVEQAVPAPIGETIVEQGSEPVSTHKAAKPVRTETLPDGTLVEHY